MLPVLAAIGGLTALSKIIADSINKSKDRKMMSRMGQQGQMGLPKGALQIPKFNPQTMEGLQQLLSMGLQGWQQNPAEFEPYAQEAKRRFQGESIPLLAERFGGSDSKRSSAFEGVLSRSQQRFDQGIEAQRQGFNQQNRNQLLQLLQLGTQPQYESVYKTRQPGFGENLAVNSLPSLIQYAPQLSELFSSWMGGS